MSCKFLVRHTGGICTALHCPVYLGLMLAFALLLPQEATARSYGISEQLARWQLNRAELFIDHGRYMQALEYADSAYEVSRHEKTRQDALRLRATLLATFLDSPDEAVAVYDLLAQEFPARTEAAAYNKALILFEAGRLKNAGEALENYQKNYPQGKYILQTEALLKAIQQQQRLPAKPVRQTAQAIRVLLASGVSSVRLEGTQAGTICTQDGTCARTLRITPAGHQLRINNQPARPSPLRLVSSVPVTVAIPGKKQKIVRGSLIVTNTAGSLRVINQVPIEAYLRSVVPAESYSHWPLATLRAQAVAARTYALYQQAHRAERPYDVRADTYDQMYGGVARETARTDQAVRETAGQVLTWQGKPILAQYTANSGGYTADAQAIFGAAKPYLIAHADPASLSGKMASWSRTYTTQQIVTALKKTGIDVTGLSAIQAAQTGPSGRLIRVRLIHSGKETILRTRTTLASSRVLRLPEILVRIHKQGHNYTFEGHGHGHGVGYSQWGAAELGKTQTYTAILSFYYPGTHLEKYW